MRAYVRHFALAFVALLMAVAAFTRVMDPAGYWGGPVIDGLNRYKPASAEYAEAVKLRQVARLQPRTIVAGNSRVDVGFDPMSPAWPGKMQPIYNLGLPGLRVGGVVEMVLHSADVSRPRQILLGVDLFDFRITEDNWKAGRREPGGESRLEPNRWRQHARMLWSLSIFNASVAAIAEQWKRYPSDISPRGFNSLSEYNDIVAREGHAALFDQRLNENLTNYIAGVKRVSWTSPGYSPEWAALDRLATICRKRGIRLVVFTYPYHANQLLMFERAGLWPAFEDWQRRLAAFSARTDVIVWNFSRVAQPTTESVPRRGDTSTHMKYYWEAGHFKSAMGDIVVRDTQNASATLGVRLTSANVDQQLADTEKGLARFTSANADIVSKIERIRQRIEARSKD